MSWFFIALGAPFLWAIVNIADQHLVKKYSTGHKGSGGLVLFSSLIGYCEENGLDLSKTRTCIKPTKTHCGTCPCCWDRRRCYLLVGINDKTKYLKPYPKKSSGYY